MITEQTEYSMEIFQADPAELARLKISPQVIVYTGDPDHPWTVTLDDLVKDALEHGRMTGSARQALADNLRDLALAVEIERKTEAI